MNEVEKQFILKELEKLDIERSQLQVAITNCRGLNLENMQTSLFKINIIINYLGSFLNG